MIYMIYFSPTYWLKAGVALLAVQNLAQGAPVPPAKTKNSLYSPAFSPRHPYEVLPPKEFDALTPYQKLWYFSNVEYVLSYDTNPISLTKLQKLNENYNAIFPAYTGARPIVVRVDSFTDDYNVRISEFQINNVHAEQDRQAGCNPSMPADYDFPSEAEAVKCLKEGEASAIGTEMIGETALCSRKMTDKVVCFTTQIPVEREITPSR